MGIGDNRATTGGPLQQHMAVPTCGGDASAGAATAAAGTAGATSIGGGVWVKSGSRLSSDRPSVHGRKTTASVAVTTARSEPPSRAVDDGHSSPRNHSMSGSSASSRGSLSSKTSFCSRSGSSSFRRSGIDGLRLGNSGDEYSHSSGDPAGATEEGKQSARVMELLTTTPKVCLSAGGKGTIALCLSNCRPRDDCSCNCQDFQDREKELL